jgi:hypothetical protein
MQVDLKQTATAAETRKPKRRRVLKILAIIVLVVSAWVLFDLYGPRSSNLRRFDPGEVGRIEAAMWRSYYEKHEARLFNQLTELLRTQYNLPFIRSNKVAYNAARAAFVFKKGRSREDYEKALPYLVDFYRDIRNVSEGEFDVDKAARLELEWWIIHRQRKQHAPGDLERSLAELAAELYRVPAERVTEHARLRAEAMDIRDTKAESGGVTEADWAKIEELLRGSWQSLYTAVNSE